MVQTSIDGFLTPLERLEEYTGKTYCTDKANGLTQAIIDTFKACGGFGERVNVSGDYRTKRIKDADGNIIEKTFRTPTRSHKGSADIHGILKGRAVMIEVKIGKDRQSAEQREYQKLVEQSGGVYYIAKDYNSFYNWLKQIV